MKPLAGIIAVAAIAIGVWQLMTPGDAVATDAPAAAQAQAGEPAVASVNAPSAVQEAAPAQAVEKPAAPDASAPRLAQQAQFTEGTDYTRYTTAQPTQSPPDTVEVIEFFMHSCPHCATLEPYVERWVSNKPSNVSFVRIPVSFNKMAAVHMRAYYAAEALGVTEDIHTDFFNEIHVKKNHLADERSLAAFFEKHGVDKEKFLGTMESFAVDSMTRKAQSIAARYRIQSVPTMVVNGKYSTDGRRAGSYQRMFQIIDYLVEKETNGQSTSEG